MPKRIKDQSLRFRGPYKRILSILTIGLILIIERLPIRISVRLGACLGWLLWLLLPRRRTIVQKNLIVISRFLGKRGLSGVVQPSVRDVFMRAGANLLGGFAFNRMSAEEAEKHLLVEGIEDLQHALADGRGVIILLAHMGPWEALAQFPEIARRLNVGASFGALYRPFNNHSLDNWYKRRREARGTRLFSRRDGFHKPVDFIRSGGMLGILADQKMRQGETVSFFGENASTTSIPGLLQRRSGAPVLSVSLSTMGTALWRIRFRRINLTALQGDTSRAVAATLCNQALEESLCDSLSDGFWFQDRFL